MIVSVILVGTTGFQYRDWVTLFYPTGLAPARWLEYYAGEFTCCELSFTCYRNPEPLAMQQLVDATPGAFQFLFRVPERLVRAEAEAYEAGREFASLIWPVREAGQLGALVARFGPEFTFMRDNFDRLCRLRDALRGMPLVAEFACPEWLAPRAARHLATNGIAVACVDGGRGPARETACLATASPGYVRFDGRRRLGPAAADASRQHDYLYSLPDLRKALVNVRRIERECGTVFVLMNNCWRAQAAVNARMFLELVKSGGV